ncbi:MAG: hypothetical protein RIF33_14985 [Cyclobacteriaceae bacterium]
MDEEYLEYLKEEERKVESKRLRLKHLEAIKQSYLDGTLSAIDCFWYDDWKEIELYSTLKDHEKLDSARFSIVLNVSLDWVVKHLDDSYFSRFSSKLLFQSHLYYWERTSSILDAWNLTRKIHFGGGNLGVRC